MIKFIRYWIRNVLGFSKTETNGLPLLILIVIVFFLAPLLFKRYAANTYSASAADKQILDSILAQLSTPAASPAPEDGPALRFQFNPNTIDLDSLLLLGLEEPIARRLINYRSAGGRFEVKQDLKKIYGLDPSRYEALAALIELPEKRIYEDRDKAIVKIDIEAPDEYIPFDNSPVIFDINQADTTQLKRVYGIGPVLSLRIIKYRDLLGGFVKKEQLKEVYGIKEEVYHTLATQIFIEPKYIPNRININQDSVKRLAAHPYVSYNLAKTIYNYRLQHGPFQSTADLLQIHLFDSVLLENIVPYIDL